MADFTIFGAGAPSGVVAGGDTGQISVSTAFYVIGVTGWRCAGIRIWIPAGTTVPAAGQKAYLWGSSGITPGGILATADFSAFAAGQWNTVLFSAPVTLIAGNYYFAQVYLPSNGYGVYPAKFGGSATPSVDTGSLFAGGAGETSPGNGSFVYGAAGLAPTTTFSGGWYGVDVVVDDGTGSSGPGSDDNVGIADTVTAVRGGLPSEIHASATVTDPLGASTPATAVFPVGGATAFHVKRRRLFEARVSWGAVSNEDVLGPEFAHEVSGPLTLGLEFNVLWPVRFAGCRIYKHPNANGSIPVRLWDRQGAGGAPRELGSQTVTWAADAGGWVEIIFDDPIDLATDVTYTVSYYAASADYVYSGYVFYVWSDVVAPLRVAPFASSTQKGGSAFRASTLQQIPDINSPSNYYIDPIVEWDSTDPVFKPDTALSYYDQWANGKPNHKFPIAIYYIEPQWWQEYADMGINTGLGGPATPDMVAACKASGLDFYPEVGFGADPQMIGLRAMMEDPAFAALVPGYYIIDEPDQYQPFTPPSTVQEWCKLVRQVDATRPIYIGMGRAVSINQTYWHQPQGSNMDTANQLWRDWVQLGDIVSGDFYTLSPDRDPAGRLGPWSYPCFIRRLKALSEGKVPVLIAIETAANYPDYPKPDMVVKTMWACVIEGCAGIELFDHRFPTSLVTRDHAYMLHTPAMKSAVSACITRIQSMVDAVITPDTGLVTAVTSSNNTSGPIGGTWGVPMHYTTRADAAYEYLWAMGFRPGSTTATFTIPSWAGATLTVLDEGRTVTVSGAGVLTDDFPADYTVHLYRKG